MATDRIVVIGGGTGNATLLRALKTRTRNLTSLVNMADDGGSTGVLRDELGVLPPGDIRQCLVALSNAPQEVRDLFNFRFPSGSLQGHSFGNIFLSAVESMSSSNEQAVRMAGDVLNIQGRVLPITTDECTLVMHAAGQKIVGQRAIEISQLPPRSYPKLSFTAPAHITPDAAAAIAKADLVVIAPGNLYCSLAPALIVDGVAEALAATKAKIAFVCNLVNKPNHTQDFAVHDYVRELERLTAPNNIDAVIYNAVMPDAAALAKYAKEQEYPVIVDADALEGAPYTAIGGDYLSKYDIVPNPGDTLIERSLIRHDADAVANTLMSLL